MYFHFSKVSSAVSHNILLDKVARNEPKMKRVKQTENCEAAHIPAGCPTSTLMESNPHKCDVNRIRERGRCRFRQWYYSFTFSPK